MERVNSYIFRAAPPPKWGKKARVQKFPTIARYATKKVEIEISEEDVREAIKAHGQGDVSACAGNFGTCRQLDRFSHNVEVEWIDWSYTRVAVCERVAKKTGRPMKTVLYALYNSLPREFDTLAGLKRLLKRILDEGPIVITLHPIVDGEHHVTGKPVNKPGPIRAMVLTNTDGSTTDVGLPVAELRIFWIAVSPLE